MFDEDKRQAYLKAMDITEWELRTSEETIPTVLPEQEAKLSIKNNNVEPINVEPINVEANSFSAKGLNWLNKASKNGLLVVLSEQRKDLSVESRQLMSNMLKSIHFLPSETGFATIDDNYDPAKPAGSLESVKAILVFGNEAGRHLVKVAGARIIPGSEVFTLDGRKIVISLHPDEIISDPAHKPQVWSDLKQLVEFFNND